MDKFILQNMMINKKTGQEMTIEEFSKIAFDGGKIEVFRNSTYQVVKRIYVSANDAVPGLVWLSIKRIDKESIHDWREFQEIKNELVGKECEGVELYPAESRCVDMANQYHLWVFDKAGYRLPFGFDERAIGTPEEAEEIGAKQRPIKKGEDNGEGRLSETEEQGEIS